MNDPRIIQPDHLAMQAARQMQAQEEARAMLNALACGIFERTAASGIREGLGPNMIRKYAQEAKQAARLFAEEFFGAPKPAPTAA